MNRKYKKISLHYLQCQYCQYCQFGGSLISPQIKQIEQNTMETDKTDKTDCANFYTTGMACRTMDKRRKRGTKVSQTRRRGWLSQ